MRGVASGDTIVHWLLLGDSTGEKTSKGVSSGDDEMDETSVASSSSVNGNFLRDHGNTTGIASSYSDQIRTELLIVSSYLIWLRWSSSYYYRRGVGTIGRCSIIWIREKPPLLVASHSTHMNEPLLFQLFTVSVSHSKCLVT